MERWGNRGVEPVCLVGVADKPGRDQRRWTILTDKVERGATGMAAETDFIFILGRRYFHATSVDATDATQRAVGADVPRAQRRRSGRKLIVCLMWTMTIRALDMFLQCRKIFIGFVYQVILVDNRMGVDAAGECGCHGGVTGGSQTVVFFGSVLESILLAWGLMGLMTGAAPLDTLSSGNFMGRSGGRRPSWGEVTGGTELSAVLVVHDEKLAILVVVGIVTGSTFHSVAKGKGDRLLDACCRSQLYFGRVGKGDGVVPGKVVAATGVRKGKTGAALYGRS